MFQTEVSAWGDLPELLEAQADADPDFADWDFLFVGYRWNTVSSFGEIASIIASHWQYARSGRLESGSSYSSIVLIGYSLGTLGIRHLVALPGPCSASYALDAESCYLFGSPSFGSNLARLPISRFFPIARALRPDSTELVALANATKNANSHSTTWPTVQLLVAEDDWIAGFGKLVYLLGFPGDQVPRQILGGHLGMLNIKSLNDDVVEELRAALR